jgi:hypothetical protein
VTYNRQSDLFAGVQDLDSNLGWNTTVGGRQRFQLSPLRNVADASVTFNFQTPITAFGAYFTLITGPCGSTTVEWGTSSFQLLSTPVGNDCSTEEYGVQFFGFVSSTAVSSVTVRHASALTLIEDYSGIDDLVFLPTTVVPEPTSLVLLGSGFVGLGVVVRRRKGRLS